MKAVKCPSDELSVTNKAIVNNNDFADDVRYLLKTIRPLNTNRQNYKFLNFKHKIDILKCQLVRVNISFLPFIGHLKLLAIVLDSLCCNENGPLCQLIKTSMLNHIVSIHQVQRNVCAMLQWKWISYRKKRMPIALFEMKN